MEELNMSKSECEKKGYTKKNKVEDIKANFYSKKRNSTTPRQAVISLEPGDVPTPTSCRYIQVPPNFMPQHWLR